MQSFAKQKMKTFDSFIIDIVAFTNKVMMFLFYFSKLRFFYQVSSNYVLSNFFQEFPLSSRVWCCSWEALVQAISVHSISPPCTILAPMFSTQRKVRPVASGGAKGALAPPPQFLAKQLTLSQPGGLIMLTTVLTSFTKNLSHICYYIQ